MSSFSLLGLTTLLLIALSAEARHLEEPPASEYLLNYFSQANDYQQNYFRQCIDLELLLRHIPVDEKTFKYFYELASQIYASRRFLHDLLVAGDVTIVTIGKDYFKEYALDPITAKQVKSTEIINNLLALLANYFNLQKYELPHYEHANCIDCLTAEEKFSSEPKKCCYSNYYEADGSCLNPKLPGAGAANREYRRLAQPYCTLRGERNACELPGARKLSLAIQSAVNRPYIVSNFPYELSEELIPSVFVHNLGQINAHDHAYSRFHSNERGHLGHSGCTIDQRTPLNDLIVASSSAPISVDCSDPFYSQYNVSCLNFVKVQTLNEDCRLRDAGSLNQATTVEDLDTIYVKNVYPGKTFINSENGDILLNEYHLPVVADHRSQQHFGLYTISYFFSRLHNLIADELRRNCQTLPGFTVFQKARAINIALYQRIFYDYILADLIGDDKVAENELSSYFETFDENQEPEILSEYGCAAGRACHIFTPDELLLFDSYGNIEASIPFKDTFYFDAQNEDLIRQVGHSSTYQPWKQNGYSDQITNYLFNDPHLCYGTDLLSLDIQRGRNCCLKPYIHYLSVFFGVCIRDWDDLRGHISDENILILQSQYTSVQDIDLIAGAQLEPQYSTSVFGKTFTRIIIEQHRRLKAGDPKWWTRIFSYEQQEQIRSPELSDLICLVFGYDQVVQDARWAWSLSNPLVPCRVRSLSDVFDAALFCDGSYA